MVWCVIQSTDVWVWEGIPVDGRLHGDSWAQCGTTGVMWIVHMLYLLLVLVVSGGLNGVTEKFGILHVVPYHDTFWSPSSSYNVVLIRRHCLWYTSNCRSHSIVLDLPKWANHCIVGRCAVRHLQEGAVWTGQDWSVHHYMNLGWQLPYK